MTYACTKSRKTNLPQGNIVDKRTWKSIRRPRFFLVKGSRSKPPVETVWKIHTDVANWHNWNPDITKSEITGPVAAGTTFHWETAGLKISSTIAEVVPLRKISWSGETAGILGIHVWNFLESSKGTFVRTEESWEGAGLPPQVDDIRKALDASLLGWLSYLKKRAERD